MTTSTPTLTLTGYLGRDSEVHVTPEREWERTAWDSLTDGEITLAGRTAPREWARLSIAVHEGRGRNRSTRC